MYLEIVNTSPLFGTINAFVGPFSSEEERNGFKKAWNKILGGPGSVIINRDKPQKNKTIITVAYAKFLLAICEKLKT